MAIRCVLDTKSEQVNAIQHKDTAYITAVPDEISPFGSGRSGWLKRSVLISSISLITLPKPIAAIAAKTRSNREVCDTITPEIQNPRITAPAAISALLTLIILMNGMINLTIFPNV